MVDWYKTFVACTLLVIATALSLISWMLGASGIFAVLYMLLGTLGFLNIYWGNQKAVSEIKSVHLDSLKHESTVKQDSKESVMKCKVLATELLTTTRILTEEFDKKSRNLKETSPGSFIQKNINLLEHQNTTETKSLVFVFGKDTNKISMLQDETSQKQNTNNLNVDGFPPIDPENIKDHVKLDHADRITNSDGNLPTGDIPATELEINQTLEDIMEIVETNSENTHGHKCENLKSSKKYSLHTDCIVMPPISTKGYPSNVSVLQDKTNNITRKSCILEREMSPEPSTCFSRLCITLLSEPESNFNSAVFKMPEQLSGRTFQESYDRGSSRIKRTLLGAPANNYEKKNCGMKKTLHDVPAGNLQETSSECFRLNARSSQKLMSNELNKRSDFCSVSDSKDEKENLC